MCNVFQDVFKCFICKMYIGLQKSTLLDVGGIIAFNILTITKR